MVLLLLRHSTAECSDEGKHSSRWSMSLPISPSGGWMLQLTGRLCHCGCSIETCCCISIILLCCIGQIKILHCLHHNLKSLVWLLVRLLKVREHINSIFFWGLGCAKFFFPKGCWSLNCSVFYRELFFFSISSAFSSTASASLLSQIPSECDTQTSFSCLCFFRRLRHEKRRLKHMTFPLAQSDLFSFFFYRGMFEEEPLMSLPDEWTCVVFFQRGANWTRFNCRATPDSAGRWTIV